VLHTVVALAETFRSLIATRYPGLEMFHVVDESLLKDLIRDGPSTAINRRVVLHAVLAREAGASVILFTCSSTSPAVDIARQVVDIPIVKVDDAMAAKAVEMGSRIGLLCTTTSTARPSSDLLLRHAAERGKRIEVKTGLRSDALAARLAGDQRKHDDILTTAAHELAADCDVLVLAQASLAHLAPDLERQTGRPVLASPLLAVEALTQYLPR
jgi:Asp/Glu/hydantoin racemase